MNGFIYRVDLADVIQRRGAFFAMLFIMFLVLKYILIVWGAIFVFGGIALVLDFDTILRYILVVLLLAIGFIPVGGGIKLWEGLIEYRKSNLDLIVILPYGAFCFALPFAQAAIYELIAGPLSEHFYRNVIIKANVLSLTLLAVMVVYLPFFYWIFRPSK